MTHNVENNTILLHSLGQWFSNVSWRTKLAFLSPSSPSTPQISTIIQSLLTILGCFSGGREPEYSAVTHDFLTWSTCSSMWQRPGDWRGTWRGEPNTTPRTSSNLPAIWDSQGWWLLVSRPHGRCWCTYCRLTINHTWVRIFLRTRRFWLSTFTFQSCQFNLIHFYLYWANSHQQASQSALSFFIVFFYLSILIAHHCHCLIKSHISHMDHFSLAVGEM